MLTSFSQDTIQDLIKKSRQNTSNFNTFMNKSLNEITQELNNKDKDIKLKALIKLIFFYLNYYDIQWASFNSMEVLSTGGAEGKRYAYIITQLQFKNNKDFIQLIPNQIRSDLKKQNLNYINSALNFLNSTMNYQIAIELLKDIESLLNINNNLIRKKVIVSLTLASEQFAKAKDFSYWEDYLIKLITLLNQGNTSTSGISICIISSIQRMCKISPSHCMTIFVELMNYFTKCEVNWNLIKIIDIFGMLFKAEPRFTKKKEFIKILSEQIVKTKSKSVEAELVKLVMKHFDCITNPNATELIQSSEERLKQLIFSQDNNLLVFSLKILREVFERQRLDNSSHNYINDIFTLLHNNNKPNGNVQILRECISILQLIVSKENYVKICEDVKELIPVLGTQAIETIIDICGKNSYGLIETNEQFTWFINMIFNIAQDQYEKDAEEKVSFVIRDLAQRLEGLREIIVAKSIALLEKVLLQNNHGEETANTKTLHIAYISLENGHSIAIDEHLQSKNESRKKYHQKKSHSTLIDILMFIIGEYSTKEISKIIDTIYKGMIENELIKKKHFVSFSYCLMKLLLKGTSSKMSQEDYDKYMKINNVNNEGESKDTLIYFRMILDYLYTNEGNGEKLRSCIFNNQMKPLSSNSQKLITLPPELDLTTCFPINDDEIQMAIKSSPKNEQKVSIDTTLYTPEIKTA